MRGVQRVEAGDYTTPTPVRFPDEIGFLTGAFNKLSAELGGLIADLEGRVRARTAELAAEMAAREQAQAIIVERERTLAAAEEREQLGRDLHDGLGQTLGYINLQAQAAIVLLEGGQAGEATEALQQLMRATQQAYTDVRAHILGLRRAPESAPEGFLAALGVYIDAFRQAYGLEVEFDAPADLPLRPFAPEMEAELLYIVQEALNNVVKHSGVSRAALAVRRYADGLEIVVADAGRGFDLSSAAERKGHFGLSVMRERAEKVGGRLDIDAAPGEGARVTVWAPLAARTPRAARLRGLRILAVDDHKIVLEGLTLVLTTHGAEVVGLAGDGIEAQKLALALRPDVILMDVHMPRCDGLEATRRIKAALPEVKVVMLTVAADDATLFDALRSGASGYLLKNVDGEEFCALLQDVMRGEVVLSPALAARVLAELTIGADEPPAAAPPPPPEAPPAEAILPLTARQREVLALVAEGYAYKQVAVQLVMTERTVKYHMGEILERLHLRSRRAAVEYARRMGILAGR